MNKIDSICAEIYQHFSNEWKAFHSFRKKIDAELYVQLETAAETRVPYV